MSHNTMPRNLAAPLLATLLPLSAFVYLKAQPAIDPSIVTPVEHFYIVSLVALLAGVLTVAIGIAGSRLRNIQVVFLAMAFSALALIFLLHGLSTPHFLLPPTRLPGVAAQLSILVTAFWFLMSALPSDFPVTAWLTRWQRALVPLWTALLLGFLGLALLEPGLVQWLPIDQAPLRWFVVALTIGLFATAAYRYLHSYAYSRFPLQIIIVYAAGWLSVAQLIMVTADMWHLSWWLYHFLFLAAVVLLAVGLWRQYVSGTGLAAALHGLVAADPAEHLTASVSHSVQALIIATEARDPYTAGHSQRVALQAVRLGEALGLAPEELRALAQGGMVHDIGKLQIPDKVLNKAGALTPDERAVIETHAAAGHEMCRRLGFMNLELGVIRSHHERWDGGGYPDGLQGKEIPRLARVLAIADVYDALTSSRPYRDAWSHERTRQYIREGSGSQFDPECVEAWLRLTAQPLEQAQGATLHRQGLEAGRALP